MSNLEREPAELVCEYIEAAAGPDAVEILQAREVPLGGPRAMPVHRTLPQRRRTTIGAWCFVDHYGPDDVSTTGGMVVPPHPHTGLQTASWLFAGEIEHRDSVGSRATVRPGELNLMTAGRGIAHSEVSTPGTTTLHGVQLWIALPGRVRDATAFFERHDAARATLDGTEVRVFIGELAGARSAASVFSPLLGAQLDLPPHADVTVPLDPGFEHGILVDAGPVHLDGTAATRTELAYLKPGRAVVRLRAGQDGGRIVLLGGEPFGEQLVMWWNFIGRSHDEIVAFRGQWQREVIAGERADGRFGAVDGYPGRALPAPELPTVRLKPRG
ncbi:pirin family protein [Luethyella okanaganae]|uniref:Pirin family protein n=1 Tax=Luethyella okanaganae TaxID=69372 RepID=A0ABW1VI61_9MICO